MGRGGKRKGAGLPKGYKFKKTLEKDAAREFTRTLITARLLPLIEAQLSHAEGLKYLVTRDKNTGKFIRVGPAMAKSANEETIEVWEKDPSTQAFIELLNRALDKAKEQALDVNVNVNVEVARRLSAARNRIHDKISHTSQIQ